MFELKRPFSRNLAVVIGINDYENVTPLGTAVNDAKKLADVLRSQPEPHNYEIVHLEEAQPGIDSLKKLLDITLPNVIKPTGKDRLLFYFAGHGYPAESVEGPAGYLVPRDAKPGKMESFLSMEYLHDALSNLDCRHLLIILDCCFAGSFRWAVTRHIAAPTVMYKERFERYTENHAWQVITSAAHDQKAFDILFDNRVKRVKEDVEHLKEDVEHSPFAEALFDALKNGTADVNGDGIVTATELYLHLSETLRDRTLELRQQQVPGLWPLKKHDKGEFIFILNENFNPENLDDAPPIDPENNPYRGLESFEAAQSKLFFGRDELIKELYDRITLPDAETNSDRPFTVVLGISGSGKSSLVKAGLIPYLTKKEAGLWQILEPMRPGTTPFLALAKAILPIANDAESSQDSIEHLSQLLQDNQTHFSQTIADWHELDQNQGKKLLLVIDQFEELITQSQSSQIQHSQDSVEQKSEWQKFLDVLAVAIQAHAQHLRIVVTLRSDFEPRFLNSAFKEYWASARFPVRAMRADELRQAIEKPAEEKALFFKDPKLVDKLIEEVGQMPGALPLLSFTLSELYNQLAQKRKNEETSDRALTLDDKFGQEGGIAGSLTRRANEVYQQIGEVENLGEAAQKTMRRVLLRMLTLEGGETTRRKVPKSELVYPTLEENERVKQVVNSLVDARLLVTGQLETGEPYIEPAHDYLIRGWITLQDWIAQNQQSILLRNRLHFDLVEWKNNKSSTDHLWISNAQVATLNEILLSDMRYSLNDDEEKFVAQSIEKAQEVNTEKEQRVLESFLLNSELLWNDDQHLESLIAITWAGKRLQVAKRAGLSPDNEIKVLTKLHQTLYQRIREKNRLSGGGNRGNSGLALSPDGETISPLSDEEVVKLTNNMLSGLRDQVYAVALSPDGNTIASASNNGTVKLWNLKGEELLNFSGHGQNIWIISVAFSPDGNTIASACNNGTAKLWNLKGKELLNFSGRSVNFSPDGKIIATTHNLINVQGARLINFCRNDSFKSVLFSPNGQILASVSHGHIAKLWNLKGEEIFIFPDNTDRVAFFPDNETVASQGNDGTVKLWNFLGEELLNFSISGYFMGVSQKGENIASVDRGRIKIWNLEGEELLNFSGHDHGVSSLVFSSDGQTIVSGGLDNTIRVWNLQRRKPLSIAGLFVAFSPNGQTIASTSPEGTLDLWNRQGEKLLTFTGYSDEYLRVAFSPDGQTIASTSRNGTVKLFDLQGEKLFTISGNFIVFSPDGKQMVSIIDKTVKLWSREGKGMLTLTGHNDYVSDVVFSPDGQTIATASSDGTVKLWNLQGGLLLTLLGHRNMVTSVVFSPDGQTIASASLDKTVKLWSRQGVIMFTFSGHDDYVNDVVFSPDGQTIASASCDGTVKLWNKKGEELLSIFWYGESFHFITFSPDSQTLATSCSDGTVKLWDIDLDSLVAKSCDWLRDYLTNNPNVTASDRKLLEDIEQ